MAAMAAMVGSARPARHGGGESAEGSAGEQRERRSERTRLLGPALSRSPPPAAGPLPCPGAGGTARVLSCDGGCAEGSPGGGCPSSLPQPRRAKDTTARSGLLMVAVAVALENTRSIMGKVLSVEQIWVQELEAPPCTLVWVFGLHCALRM